MSNLLFVITFCLSLITSPFFMYRQNFVLCHLSPLFCSNSQRMWTADYRLVHVYLEYFQIQIYLFLYKCLMYKCN
jgi:hypothetical protein